MFKALTAWLDAFTEASSARRLLLSMLVLLPIAALIAAYLWLHQPPYRVLFPRLSDHAGGEVMAALDQLNIAYRLSDADGTIEVPANKLYAARYQLAARGLPKPDTQGFESAENAPTFGLSQFQEQLRYQHALETELVRSIQTLDAVATARVHLALPKVSPFLRDPPPVTAAVLVQLKPHHSLANEQVTAIQRMVAASVPRLKSADVSVLDPQGQLLGKVEPAVETKGTALETELTRRVVEVLTAWLGADKAKVQVTSTLAGDGRVRRVNATVMLPSDASPQVIAQATTLTRQAMGWDVHRGDNVSVFALPPAPFLPVITPAISKAVSPVAAPVPVTEMESDVAWPWILGIGATGVGLLMWRRVRKRNLLPSVADEDALSDGESFDALLQTSRRQTLDNPRVTADVIRMWMRA